MRNRKHGHEGRYMSTCKACVFEHARLRATKLGKEVYLFQTDNEWDFSDIEPNRDYEKVYSKAFIH